MASFTGLATETLLEIASYLDSQSDIAALSQVTRQFYHVYGSLLWGREAKVRSIGPGPIHWAAGYGNEEAMVRALDAGIPADLPAGTRNPNADLEAGQLLRARHRYVVPTEPFDWDDEFGLDVEECRQIMLQGSWWCPIHLAAANGRTKIVEILLDGGASIDNVSRHCCSCDETVITEAARKHGFSERTGMYGWTALHVAMCHGHIETAKALLARGASVEVFQVYPDLIHTLDRGPITAMHQAAGLGHVDLLEFLMDGNYQTDVNILGNRVGAPLTQALEFGRWDSTIPWLLARGATIEHKPMRTHRSPLLLACGKTRDYEDAIRLVDLSLELGFPTFSGYGILQHIVNRDVPFDDRRQLELMSRLISGGVSADDWPGEWNTTALAIASARAHVSAMRLLIDAGADVNLPNQDGILPLAQVGERIGDGPSHVEPMAIHTAAQLLCDAGSKIPDLNYILSRAHLRSTPILGGRSFIPLQSEQQRLVTLGRLFLENGANPNSEVGSERRPFVSAVNLENLPLAVAILEHGGRPKPGELDENFHTWHGWELEGARSVTFILNLDYSRYGIEPLSDETMDHIQLTSIRSQNWTLASDMIKKRASW